MKELRPDIEKQMVAFQQAEPRAHLIIRERFNSHKWWTIMGFESEKYVLNLASEIQNTSAELESITWPVQRIGMLSGIQYDTFLLCFVRKTSLDFESLKHLVLKQGGTWAEEEMKDGNDLFPITHGYHWALLKTLEAILKQYKHLDN